MKKLRSSLSKKLKGNAGETIAEVLIALLIAALALTMLASVITTAARIITDSKKTMQDYYDANSELTTRPDSADGELASKGNLTLTFKLKAGEEDEEDDDPEINLISGSESLGITYFVNNVVSVKKHDRDTSVVAFWLTP